MHHGASRSTSGPVIIAVMGLGETLMVLIIQGASTLDSDGAVFMCEKWTEEGCMGSLWLVNEHRSVRISHEQNLLTLLVSKISGTGSKAICTT